MRKGYWIVIGWSLFVSILSEYRGILVDEKEGFFYDNYTIIKRVGLTFVLYFIPSLIIIYLYYRFKDKTK